MARVILAISASLISRASHHALAPARSAESFGDELSAPAEAARKTEMLVVSRDLLDLD
jgi:hypothetical protein